MSDEQQQFEKTPENLLALARQMDEEDGGWGELPEHAT